MLTEKEAEAACRDLASRGDVELGKLFIANGFICALMGGPRADTIFARLHKLVVEEIKRRSLKMKGKLN